MNYEAVQLVRAARGIGGMARALLFDLAIYANETGEASTSQRRLADDLDIDVRRVRRIMNELVYCDLIQVTQKGQGRGVITTYRFMLKGGSNAPFKSQKEVMEAPFFDEKKEGAGALDSGQKGGADTLLSDEKKEGKNDEKKRVKSARKRGRPCPPEVNISKGKGRRAPARARESHAQNQDQEQGAGAELWPAVLELLRREIDPEPFGAYLAGAECLRLGGARIVLAAPSDFIRRWILHNYADQIRAAARAVLGGAAEPELDVRIMIQE